MQNKNQLFPSFSDSSLSRRKLNDQKFKKDIDESSAPLTMSSRHALSRLGASLISWDVAIGYCRSACLRPNRSMAGWLLLRWSDSFCRFCCLKKPSPLTVTLSQYLTDRRFRETANQDLHSLTYGVFFSIPLKEPVEWSHDYHW